jgi:hypothetical protein
MKSEDIKIKQISMKLLRDILHENGIEYISDIKNISLILELKTLEIEEFKERANKNLENLRIKFLEQDEQLKTKDKRMDELIVEGQKWVNKFFELQKSFQELNNAYMNCLLDKEEPVQNKRLKLLE